MKPRSFRLRLALQFSALMTVTFVGIGAGAVLLLRRALTAQLDGTLLRLASIEAAAVSDAPDSAVHFHEGVFTAPRSEGATELERYAQIWRDDGIAVLRSQSLGTRDLPRDSLAFAAARQGEITLATTEWHGERLRTVFYPLGLLAPAHRAHILQVAAPLRPVQSVLSTLGRLLLGLGLIVLALTFFGGWMLAGRAVRPAREIAEQAEAITAGSLAARIQAHADTTEYERLVAVLNGMLERLDSAFAAQQRFVADAGHEIRHPVAVLRAALELALRRERSPEEYRRAIEDAAGQADRIGVLAEGLLTLARADAGVLRPERTRQDLGELARSAARRFDTVAANRGITLTVRAAPVLASVDAELVDRVLDNLLDNALKFTPAGGVVEVVVERDGGHAFVHVADTGPGVPVEYRSRLFERFFRADASRSPEGGAGLGLAIAKGIAEAHGGDVLYQPREPTGSCFTLRLPLSWIPV